MIRFRLTHLSVGLALLGVSGCGGSSSSSTSPTTGVPSAAFVISNLRVTPITAHGLVFTVDFTNPTGTTAAGHCIGVTQPDSFTVPITELLNGTISTSTSGTVQCQVQFNVASGTPVNGTFLLEDGTTGTPNLSNGLSFSAVLPERLSAGSGP